MHRGVARLIKVRRMNAARDDLAQDLNASRLEHGSKYWQIDKRARKTNGSCALPPTCLETERALFRAGIALDHAAGTR